MTEFKNLFDTIVTFSPKVARITGSVDTAIFLHQMLYWWERKSADQIYKTIAEFEQETTLSRYQQDAAIKKLAQIGFIEVFLQGLPPKRHFIVKIDRIIEVLKDDANCKKFTNLIVNNQQIELQKTDKSICKKPTKLFVNNQQNDLRKTDKSNCKKLANRFVRNQQILYTEITTEITSEITSENTTKNIFKNTDEIKISSENKKNNFDLILNENISSKNEKTKPPNSGGSPFENNSLHFRMKKYFIEFFKKQTEIDYFWEAKDASNLKSIIRKIEFVAKQKNDEIDDEKIIKSFHLLMNVAKKDNWILNKLSVAIINMKFNELVSKINFKQNGEYSESRQTGIGKELRNELFASIWGLQSNERFA